MSASNYRHVFSSTYGTRTVVTVIIRKGVLVAKYTYSTKGDPAQISQIFIEGAQHTDPSDFAGPDEKETDRL